MMHYTKACHTGEIDSTLCGCCSDCSSCCYTFFCFPCATSHAWADSRGEHCNCCHCIIFPSGLWTRENIRFVRGMEPRYCCDLMTCVFCPFCFASQNQREIKLINAQSQVNS